MSNDHLPLVYPLVRSHFVQGRFYHIDFGGSGAEVFEGGPVTGKFLLVIKPNIITKFSS